MKLFKTVLVLSFIVAFTKIATAQAPQLRKDSIIKALSTEKDPYKKESLLKLWEANIPADKVNGYDWPRILVAREFAKAKNFEKSYEYGMQIDTLFFRTDVVYSLGSYMVKHGDTTRGLKLLKRALASGEKFRDTDPKTGHNNHLYAQESYSGSVLDYFNLMFEMRNYNEALAYAKVSEHYSAANAIDSSFYATYAKTLLALNKKAESLGPLEKYMKSGGNDKNLLANLNSAYLATGKPQKSYKMYLATLKAEQNAILKAANTLKVAPEFNLKGMDGKMVSLTSLKGKVVILDFWATWCGPCVQSFPAMQKVVTHYKNDTDVVFLFVDTFENIPDYEVKVKALIANSKYDFKVLFDPKDKTAGKYLTADAYSIKNIPTKIIVDGNGKIRFTLSGFSGDDKAAVEELVTLIERAKKA